MTNYADAARELSICINLAKHLISGNYKAEEAVKSWHALADDAAKSYAQQHALASQWNSMFTVSDRKEAAVYFAEYYEELICFEAEKMAGAQYALVKIFDYTRDTNGNPTARHIAVESNSEGLIAADAIKTTPQRRQTGTSDYLDGVPDALSKGKFKIEAYERISVKGSRAQGATFVLFKHRAIEIPDAEQTRT
jgi:hypothetical protein